MGLSKSFDKGELYENVKLARTDPLKNPGLTLRYVVNRILGRKSKYPPQGASDLHRERI
jgi:hypothetical protein